MALLNILKINLRWHLRILCFVYPVHAYLTKLIIEELRPSLESMIIPFLIFSTSVTFTGLAALHSKTTKVGWPWFILAIGYTIWATAFSGDFFSLYSLTKNKGLVGSSIDKRMLISIHNEHQGIIGDGLDDFFLVAAHDSTVQDQTTNPIDSEELSPKEVPKEIMEVAPDIQKLFSAEMKTQRKHAAHWLAPTYAISLMFVYLGTYDIFIFVKGGCVTPNEDPDNFNILPTDSSDLTSV